MKKHFKTRRQLITAVCLLAGVMLLTVSVYANYDNASGYTSYKNAVKDLLLRTDNFTAGADLKLEFDGDLIEYDKYYVQYAGKDGYVAKTEHRAEGEEPVGTEVYQTADTDTLADPVTKTYNRYDSSYDSYGNILGVSKDDKQSMKLIRFMELSADLLVGDLKNNVVLLSKTDGEREYSIDVNKDQMPEVVNAGISLIFGASNATGDAQQHDGYVEYEDEQAVMKLYFKETGQEGLYDLCNNGWDNDEIERLYGSEEEFMEEYDRISGGMYRKYEKIFADKYGSKGVLYVKYDGETEHYGSELEFLTENRMLQDNWLRLMGEDPYIENVKMTVRFDDKDRIVENNIEGTMTGTDEKGSVHRAVLSVRIKLGDYGKTVLDKFDSTGYKEEVFY